MLYLIYVHIVSVLSTLMQIVVCIDFDLILITNSLTHTLIIVNLSILVLYKLAVNSMQTILFISKFTTSQKSIPQNVDCSLFTDFETVLVIFTVTPITSIV